MELRPYQAEAVEAVLNEWQSGRRRTLLVQATGTGKTIVAAKVAEDRVKNGGRVLMMAHRDELLTQARDKIRAATGMDTSLEKSKSTSLGTGLPITVGSVQSLSRGRRLENFSPDHFTDIIIDEAHHSLSPTYQKVLKHFPNANVLGITATPDRGDMKDLGDYYESLAYEYNIDKAIEDGYLCPITAKMIPLKLDISKVGLHQGDFAPGESACALEPYLDSIASHMEKCCEGRKTVVFVPLVRIAEKFVKILNMHGFSAAEVNGKSKYRRKILNDFRDGKYNVLCNAMLLTEGWDCPEVDCIVVLRPTKIRSLYAQMVGRGTRIWPGKENLLLLDFLWMTAKHDLCKPSCLVSKDEKTALKIDRLIRKNGEYDLMEAEESAARDVLAEREKALASAIEGNTGRNGRSVDPIKYALSIMAEDIAEYTPTFEWEKEPPTVRQLEYLSRRGIHTGAISTKGLASMLIDKLAKRSVKGLSTPRQIMYLEGLGYRNVGDWSFRQASSMIGMISRNGWEILKCYDPKTFVPAENWR